MADESVLGFTGAFVDPVTAAYPLGDGYRWFLPSLMRFNAPDDFSPFGAGGINPYAYCAGDSINYSDPSGHVGGWFGVIQNNAEDEFDSMPNMTWKEYTDAKTTHSIAFDSHLKDPKGRHPHPGLFRFDENYEEISAHAKWGSEDPSAVFAGTRPPSHTKSQGDGSGGAPPPTGSGTPPVVKDGNGSIVRKFPDNDPFPETYPEQQKFVAWVKKDAGEPPDWFRKKYSRKDYDRYWIVSSLAKALKRRNIRAIDLTNYDAKELAKDLGFTDMGYIAIQVKSDSDQAHRQLILGTVAFGY